MGCELEEGCSSDDHEYEYNNNNIKNWNWELGGWATLFALFLILFFHSLRSFLSKQRRRRLEPPSISHASPDLQFRLLEEVAVSESDLKFLIEKLDENCNSNENWEHVIHKRNKLVSYTASCSKPKDGPAKYLSVTVFEDCSPDTLRDFYMDNDYRLQWDSTVLLHHQLHIHPSLGIEVGRTLKKFPLLTPREYVLAWRLWRSRQHHSFYCFIKDCEHPSAPRQKKYVRVGFFRSGWRIRKVPGRNACEIKMYHQEDAGLNADMAKLAFARGIWSYICKMDNALCKYKALNRPQMCPAVTALSLIQKVPPELESMNIAADAPVTRVDGLVADGTKEKKLSRRPSRKVLANGLLLLGGVICLSRGHSGLGAKVAVAYILTKLRKGNTSPGQSGH